MKILKGTVINGVVVVDGEAPREGAELRIVECEPEDGAPYVLSPEEEEELLAADEEIERGELYDAADVMAELKRLRG